MFGISGVELLIILLFAFLILGPDKLPGIAKTAGEAIARFRDARKDMDDTLKEAGLTDPKTGKPVSNPVDMLDRVAKVAAEGKGEEIAQKMASAATSAAASVIKPKDAAPAAEAAERGAVAATDAADAPSAARTEAPAAKPATRTESFAERKARYEREHAAREAAKGEVPASSEVPEAAEPPAADAPAVEAPAAEAPADRMPAAETPAQGGDA